MKSTPFVSLLMPIRNEAAFIERGLGAVFAQDYPSDLMEVIVADGMSTDGTRDIVQSMKEKHPGLRLVDNPGQIVATGLNMAMACAKGDIIIRVDGHCEIAPDYVTQCVAHLQEDNVDAVGGPIETIGSTFLSQVIAQGMSSTFGVGNSSFRTEKSKSMLVDTVAFPAYTREAINLAGPFDEELVRNQDDEYNYRLRELGGKVLLTPDVQSRYYSRSSISSLWKQYFQYGSWKVRVMQKHPQQMRPRQFAPPFLAAALIGATLARILFRTGRPLALVLGFYCMANLAASIITARKNGWRQLTALPVVFATLHLSYGLGFLAGLAKFWNRWGDRETRNGGPK